MIVSRNEGRIPGVGGLQLAYRTWEAAAPRAALLHVHGLSDHSGRYEAFGSAAAREGVSVFTLDLRGHGGSEGRRGHASSFDCLLQDVDRFRREVQGLLHPRTPLFVLGNSMGGLIALRYVEEYDTTLAGAILIAPWLGTALPAPGWKLALAGLAARFAPALPFRARIPPEALSRRPEIGSRYREDPLAHDTITPRLFVEANRAMGLAHQRAERIRTPLLFLLAGGDRIVDTDRAEAFARALVQPDVTIRVYEGAFHELLHDTISDDVQRELLDWVGAHLPRRARVTAGD